MTQKKEHTLKPFNLEKALAGEPVVTRDGKEVTQITFFDCEDVYPIVAVTNKIKRSFTVDGFFLESNAPHRFNLFMKPKTRIINGFEVPAPTTVAPSKGTCYFAADPTTGQWAQALKWLGDKLDLLWLERGLVFETPDDAVANAKAMLGINPYGE